MSRLQFIATLTLACVSAGIGGAVSQRMLSGEAAFATAAASPARVVIAESFVLVDKQGRKRSEWRFTDEASVKLTFYGATGKSLVTIESSDNGSGLELLDAEGKGRVALGATGDMGGSVLCYDPKGARRVGLRASKAGWSGLLLSDTMQRSRMQMTVEDRGASIILLDATGIQRLGIVNGDEDGPALGAHDAKGRLIWRAP